jgi:hypothetical protein
MFGQMTRRKKLIPARYFLKERRRGIKTILCHVFTASKI